MYAEEPKYDVYTEFACNGDTAIGTSRTKTLHVPGGSCHLGSEVARYQGTMLQIPILRTSRSVSWEYFIYVEGIVTLASLVAGTLMAVVA